MQKKIIKLIPGFSISIFIALFSTFLLKLIPIHIIGASVLSLLIGMLLNTKINISHFSSGLKFTSKKILKFSIIILGASLNIATIFNVGKMSLIVMAFTLFTCFGGGYIVGKLLKINWKLSNLISAGTGICGGSAIAALAPVINANDDDIAYAISATFIFDIFMIILFPILGHLLNLSDIAYGLWAGTAVNDTSSVVAAGFAFSEKAGNFATMVKLTRTLSIIPVVMIFSIITKKKEKETQDSKKSYMSIIPWFILGFLFLAILNSIGLIPLNLSIFLKNLSKFLMTASLAAIGLNTNINNLKKSGFNPMIHGFIISLLVVIVALSVEYFIGLV